MKKGNNPAAADQMAAQDKPQSVQQQYPGFVENVHAPFVYFDLAVAYGSLNGMIQVDLGAQINSPKPRGEGVHTAVTSVARLRCSPSAAVTLRDSLNLALQTLSEPKTIPPKNKQQ